MALEWITVDVRAVGLTFSAPLSLSVDSPRVEFCGYSNPHPSENKIHLRIQMYGKFRRSKPATTPTFDPNDRPSHRIDTSAGRDEKKGSYLPDNLPGCSELDEDFF